jgi:hypothetical protein
MLPRTLTIAVLVTICLSESLAQPFNPTVTIQPNPVPGTITATAPAAPSPSLWNWHYQPAFAPNIIQDYYPANSLQRTIWGIAPYPPGQPRLSEVLTAL